MPMTRNASETAISICGTGVDAMRIGMAMDAVSGMSPSVVAVRPRGALRIDSRKISGATSGMSAMNCTEYVVPAARLSIHLGFGDLEGIRRSLAACLDGAAAPFAVIATSRVPLDEYRGNPEIEPLLDRLYDGARPRI